jgi:single-stranded DNA-binding protein
VPNADGKRNLNSVLIDGKVVADPQINRSERGSEYAEVSIASRRLFEVDGEVESELHFFRVEAWGSLGVKMMEVIGEGSDIRIIGRLKQVRTMPIDEDGHWDSEVKIVAEHLVIRPKKTEQNGMDRELTLEAEAT